jgi:hypothetical protein
MEQDDMASEILGDRRVAFERKPLKDPQSGGRSPQQAGPPVVNDGPELLRSNHC